jgi:DNA gyrase subunit B
MALTDAGTAARKLPASQPITGPALENLARNWLATEAVIERLAHLVHPDILHAIVRHNIAVDLSGEEGAQKSAARLVAVHPRQDTSVRVKLR